MAKIKIQTTKKDEPDEPEDQAPEPEADEFTPDPEVHPQDGGPVTEHEDDDVEELARDMAKDVAAKVDVKEAPLTRPTVERADPDEDLNIDPDTNYPKIAMLRVTMGDDDEQSMDEWLETVREALKDVTKNTTVMTTHRLINGKQVANHRYEEELPDDS